MRKSSFGQLSGRLSSGPLRVKNDGGGMQKSLGSRTPQGKLYSTAASSRPRSSIPVSLASGMSQRSSSIGMRSSSIGARNSGIGVRSRSEVPKDPRPVFDKSYQQRCIKTLLEFLTENNYPHTISQKLLLSPPSKEFFRIFQFIYCQIDPAFQMSKKMEEDVPYALKRLGYPFNISKSSMYAVGTPHTWPYLLAALVWLVDLVRYTQSLSPALLDSLAFPPGDQEFDSVPDDKIKFEYKCQTYDAFMKGDDDYDVYDEDLEKVLGEKFLGQSGGIEAVRSENLRLSEEIELLDQEMGRVDKLQEQQEIMLLDERKFRDYLTEVQNVIRKHQQMLQDAVEQRSSLEQELKSMVAKNQHMQAIYEQQDLTPADVERLRAARQELQRQEEGLDREVDAIDTDIWKEEMSIAKLLERVDSSLGEYSKLARSLGLIPSTTELANGINFELRSCIQELDNKFESVIKPALVAMRKKGKEAIHQLESGKLQGEVLLEQFSEQEAELKEEIAKLEKDIKIKDEDVEHRKQLYQRDLEGLQSTVDQLQDEIRTLQTSSQISLQDAERELRETQSWAEVKKAEMIRKEQEYAIFLTNVFTLVIDHKSHVQVQLKNLEKDMSQAVCQEQERLQRVENHSQKLRAHISAELKK